MQRFTPFVAAALICGTHVGAWSLWGRGHGGTSAPTSPYQEKHAVEGRGKSAR